MRVRVVGAKHSSVAAYLGVTPCQDNMTIYDLVAFCDIGRKERTRNPMAADAVTICQKSMCSDKIFLTPQYV